MHRAKGAPDDVIRVGPNGGGHSQFSSNSGSFPVFTLTFWGFIWTFWGFIWGFWVLSGHSWGLSGDSGGISGDSIFQSRWG